MHLLQLVQHAVAYLSCCTCLHALVVPATQVCTWQQNLCRSGSRTACATQRDPTQAHTCMQTPMCMISLVVDDRQWFISQKGMGCTGSNRDVSFCAWMLLPRYPEMLVVEDATLDSRWAMHGMQGWKDGSL